MNRIIKFRAFWKDTKKIIPNFMEEYICDALNDDMFIINQYTGLLDKNGKEIYEGDILHITTKDMVNLNYRTIVEWSPKGFYKEFTNFDNAEVVGNIYKNSLLIDTKK